MARRLLFAVILLVVSVSLNAQASPAGFDGVQKWSAGLTPTGITSLVSFYSTDPPASYIGKDHKQAPDIAPEIDFWQGLISSGAKNVEVKTMSEQDQQGLHVVKVAISMTMTTPDGPRTRYVTEQQAWQPQSGGWRIVMASHSDVVKMRPAMKLNPNLYAKNVDARAEIKEAVAKSKSDHRRIILVFGANWCYDCHVLDQAFHQPDVAPILTKNFRVVHVDIGDDGKKNNDVAAEYQVPLEKGVPALAVLGPDGKLLYSQKNGEFESARTLDPDEVIKFLNKWKS